MKSYRPERRRETRVSPKGTVVVRADTYVMRGRIANISLGGLAVATRTTAPERLLGASVDMSVRLDDRDSGWLELGGRIARIGANRMAIVIGAVPLSFTRIIDETVSRSHRNDRDLSVVLVDSVEERRAQIADAFREAGCSVIEVSTPLEAIVRLGESHFEPVVIAIAESLPMTISEELRAFVDTEHPSAWLVTIGDAVNAPDGFAHWLSAANPDVDLVARIRRLLTTFGRR